MMYRRFTAMLLILCLLLAGCGSEQSPQGTIRPAEQPSSQTQPAAEDKDAQKEEKHVSFGALEGGIYENTYVGYGCTLGEGWTYKSAEEIQDISNMTQELLDGTDLDNEGNAMPHITDMIAENVGEMKSINVQYTRLSPQEKITQGMMTEENLIEGVLSQKDTLVASYRQAGIEVESMEKVQVTFLGESRYAVHTTSTVQGVNYYILQIFDIHLGNYYVTLTLASFIEDTTYEMLDLFYPLS